MTVGDLTTETRARNVSLLGLILQVVLGVCMILLYALNDSVATFAAAKYLLGGVFMWLALLLIYQQRRHVAEEMLESEELGKERRAAGTGTIFELEQEEFLVAQRRLNWMYRWVLPGLVLLTVGYLLLSYFIRVAWRVGLDITDDVQWPPVQHASLSMLCVLGVAAAAFLFSRYLSGMSRQAEYRLLKSASIYLFGNALMCFLLTLCLGLVSREWVVPERVLEVVINYLMLLLALEFLINFVLDFYRPRVADQAYRPAFESRLVGMVSEPGGIAKSIADAVNYQFGFEVSATWFYKTLERQIVPLATISVFVLAGMTSFAVVDADELAVVERFGRRLSEQPLEPGLKFKLPWPVDRLRKAKVGLVQEVVIGEAAGEREEPEEGREEVITWTEEHKYVPFVDVLVATPEPAGRNPAPGDRGPETGAVAVSILRISMPVQYRVNPDRFFDYLYNYADPRTMLRDIAYRELVKQAVHFDYQKIMAEQRKEVTDKLHRLIQDKCDAMQMGLEIVHVGLRDIHPPTESDVAATFQKVATAEQERDTLIQSAGIERTKELVSVAGDVGRAEKIFELLQRKEALPADDAEGSRRVDQEINTYMQGDADTGILPIRGEAGQTLAEARAYSQVEINRAAAKVNTFKLEVTSYQASPRLYRMRKVLDALSEELDEVRKYVLVLDPEKTDLIIEMDERESSGLEIIESSNAP